MEVALNTRFRVVAYPQDNLAKKQSALALAQEQLAGVLAKVQALKDRYDDSTSRKRALEEELADLEGKLERAEKLVTGLAGAWAGRQRCLTAVAPCYNAGTSGLLQFFTM